jgi:3,4-dihydroxy 2-butanone 4-phosphate synthase/GTP cyclohydrolase II
LLRADVEEGFSLGSEEKYDRSLSAGVALPEGGLLLRELQSEASVALASCEELIEEARNGRMFILVDDEDRENEGDLVVPAQFASPAAITFMARRGCGLVCLAMSAGRVNELGLPPMSVSNETRHQTAFTVSIEAKEGVKTGISAQDRARTISVAIDPGSGRDALVTPGHVFPLVAREGGTLVRAGHTEAAVDIARLAGLNPAGAICEIMNEDGTMARLPELATFAAEYRLKLGSIADLVAYRRRTERLVRRVGEGRLGREAGRDWKSVDYAHALDGSQHLALLFGEPSGQAPVLAHLCAANPLDELFAAPHGFALRQVMRAVEAAGRGVVVVERYPAEGAVIDYGVGAQILLDLGIPDVVLLAQEPRAVLELSRCGVRTVEQRSLQTGELSA